MSNTNKSKPTEIGAIPADWQISTIEDATEKIIDYRGKTPPKTHSGVPLVTAQIVKKGHILEPEEFISERDYESWMRRGTVQKGDVIITTEAPMGEVAQLDNRKVALAQRIITLRGKRAVLDNDFLSYVLQSPMLQNELRKRESGTTVTGIKQSELRKVRLPIPSYAEQEAIAKILSDLDSKIELNQQMNRTMEAIVKAIFKHWFIDFEFPNDEGKPYKSSGGNLTDSGMGKIPSEWKVGEIDAIAQNTRRAVLPREVKQGTPYIGLEHMPRRSISLSEWGDASGVISNKFQFSQGEILFGKLRPYFHKVGVAPVNGVCSTDILVISAKSSEWYGLVLGHVTSDEFVKYTDATSTGTKMPRTNWKDMAHYPIAIPPSMIARTFSAIITSLTQKTIFNVIQTRRLNEIRDALLPRLMSGKIRVPLEVR